MKQQAKTKLVPPDRERCQAEKPGEGPFVMGGEIGDPLRGYRVRCRSVPTVIATERRPGADGQRGQMSLCDECKVALVEQLGPKFATFRRIHRNLDETIETIHFEEDPRR